MSSMENGITRSSRTKLNVYVIMSQPLSANFNKFDSSIIDYTAFHRMETRLWAIKLGKVE